MFNYEIIQYFSKVPRILNHKTLIHKLSNSLIPNFIPINHPTAKIQQHIPIIIRAVHQINQHKASQSRMPNAYNITHKLTVKPAQLSEYSILIFISIIALVEYSTVLLMDFCE